MIGGGIDRGGPKDSETAPNSFLTKPNEKRFWCFGADMYKSTDVHLVANLFQRHDLVEASPEMWTQSQWPLPPSPAPASNPFSSAGQATSWRSIRRAVQWPSWNRWCLFPTERLASLTWSAAGLVTNSILFCSLFTIKDRFKKCVFNKRII